MHGWLIQYKWKIQPYQPETYTGICFCCVQQSWNVTQEMQYLLCLFKPIAQTCLICSLFLKNQIGTMYTSVVIHGQADLINPWD